MGKLFSGGIGRWGVLAGGGIPRKWNIQKLGVGGPIITKCQFVFRG